MIPPQPRSTLFPYTTLFRSLKLSRHWSLMKRLNALLVHIDNYKTGLARHAVQDSSFEKKEISDRKSTRLNSSHTVISYAVFCLKKKKKKKKKIITTKTQKI